MRAGLRVVGEDEIHERVFGRFLPGFGDVFQRLAVELLQFRIFHRRDEHAGGAAAIEIEIFPVGMIGGEVLFDAGANLRDLSDAPEFLRAAVGDPRR